MSADFIYNFPVTAPLLVMHLDAYKARAFTGYNGDNVYVFARCNMTAFATIQEGVEEANSTTFAQALMRMQLRYGFWGTIVLDKVSKFYATFHETTELLGMHVHTLSGSNH